MMRGRICLVALGVAAALAVSASTADAQVRFELRPVAQIESPTDVVSPPDSKKVEFMVNRMGKIRVMKSGRLLPTPFLDIQDLVSTAWVEQGLLGIAFSPDYKKTGKFYIDYTAKNNDVMIVEYRRSREDPYVADPVTRRVVLRIPPSNNSPNHNGGELLFHHDLLYIAVGDGNNPGDPANNAQNIESLRGKILRIDPDPNETEGRTYTVPATNPFVNKPGRDEIYSYGFRNPHSFGFSKGADGKTWLTVADVGEQRYEELNYLPLNYAWGGNFGWKIYEGVSPYNCADVCLNGGDQPITTPLIFPQIVYSHKVGCAIIGGPVVTDSALPKIDGRIIYGDFCGNRIHTAAPRAGWITDDKPLGVWMPPGKGHHPALNGISADGWGRIYMYSDFGTVYRLYEVHFKKKPGKKDPGTKKPGNKKPGTKKPGTKKPKVTTPDTKSGKN